MTVEKKEGFTIVSPSGKLDTITAPEFSKNLSALLEEKPKGCIINLKDVSFLSSSGLQALLSGAKKSKKEGIKYGVCGMNELINDVFTLSGFDRFISSFEDIQGAMENL